MQNQLSILFSEDNQDDYLLMKLALQELDLNVLTDCVARTEDLQEKLLNNEFDLFIIDYDIPGYHIHDFMDMINSNDSNASIIIVSGTMSEEQVIEALKRGARDYVMKDNLKRLPNAVRNEYFNATIRKKLESTTEKAHITGELLRVYLENVDDVISIVSGDGMIRYTSPSSKKVTGYTDDETIGMGYFETVHQDDLPDLKKVLNEILNSDGTTRTIQYRRLHKDGYYIWIETKGRAAREDKSGDIELVCTCRNITKIKNAESALNSSEKRFKVLVENSTDIFSLMSADGKMIYNSPAFYALLGYTEDNIINKKVYDFIHPQDRDMTMKLLEDVIPLSGYGDDFHNFRFRAANGDWVYLETRASNQLDDPDIGALVLSSRDVTKRIESENTIAFQQLNIDRLSEATIGYLDLGINDNLYTYIADKLQDMLPNAIIAVNSYNADDNLLVSESLIGLDVLNKTLTKYVVQVSTGSVYTPTPEVLEKLRNGKLAQVPEGIHALLFGTIPQKVCDYIHDIMGITGVYAMGLVWKEQLYGNVVIITRENTPQINPNVVQTFVSVASVALRRKHAEQVLLESLREKEVMLKEIHHRVKNNLQIVSSLLELQAFQLTDPAVRLLFSESQTRVRSMAMVHEKIYQSNDLSNINYRDYLEQLIAYLFESYMPKNIESEIQADDVMLNIDTAVPMGIIINELVTNSLKYAFPDNRKGKIYTHLRQIGSDVELVVGDNGVGMPPLNSANARNTLGLELVNALVDQLDATLMISNESGTRYTITVANER